MYDGDGSMFGIEEEEEIQQCSEILRQGNLLHRYIAAVGGMLVEQKSTLPTGFLFDVNEPEAMVRCIRDAAHLHSRSLSDA